MRKIGRGKQKNGRMKRKVEETSCMHLTKMEIIVGGAVVKAACNMIK